MPPPARYLRSHAEGLLLEGGEPGLRPLLITAGKDGGVACRVVHRDRRPSLPQESAHPSLAAQTAPKVRIEGLFGVYAFSGGPYAAVILESEPLLKRDKSTQVFADAKLRWPRDACHAFRLRRATKVAVVPVSNANRRSRASAPGRGPVSEILESALRKRPWVFSRDSDAATLTSTRASDARDYALAERQALRQRGSIKAEDAARQRFERADAAFLWNQRVLAPVVIVGGNHVASTAWSAVREAHATPRARTGAWREQSHRETADRTHAQQKQKTTQVEAGAAAWCCACACIVATACDLGAVDDAEDEGPAPCAAIVLTRLGVDTGARLVRRGLGRDGSLSSYAETEVLVAAAATPDRPARAYAFTLSRASPPVALEDDAPSQSRGALLKRKLSISKKDLSQPPTPVNARHARTDARKLDGAVEQLLARTKTTQVTVVDLTARAPSTCSVASSLVRKRLKQACLSLAPAKRGARVRHVVVGPSEALAQVPVAHDITRLRVASQGQQLQKNTVLVVGCDEVDETDVLLCDLSTETILKAAEDDALGPDGFTPADATYASLQLEACWRRHGTVYPR